MPTPDHTSQPVPRDPRRIPVVVQAVAWGVALGVVGWLEAVRLAEFEWRSNGLMGWLSSMDPTTSPHLMWLLIAPAFWFLRSAPLREKGEPGSPPRENRQRTAFVGLLIFATSLGASYWVSARTVRAGEESFQFGSLPPPTTTSTATAFRLGHSSLVG